MMMMIMMMMMMMKMILIIVILMIEIMKMIEMIDMISWIIMRFRFSDRQWVLDCDEGTQLLGVTWASSWNWSACPSRRSCSLPEPRR